MRNARKHCRIGNKGCLLPGRDRNRARGCRDGCGGVPVAVPLSGEMPQEDEGDESEEEGLDGRGCGSARDIRADTVREPSGIHGICIREAASGIRKDGIQQDKETDVMTREEYRNRCLHHFDGECTRGCKDPSQFRQCDGICPRMRKYDTRYGNQKN